MPYYKQKAISNIEINFEILSGNSMRNHFKFGPLNDL